IRAIFHTAWAIRRRLRPARTLLCYTTAATEGLRDAKFGRFVRRAASRGVEQHNFWRCDDAARVPCSDGAVSGRGAGLVNDLGRLSRASRRPAAQLPRGGDVLVRPSAPVGLRTARDAVGRLP